MLLHLGFFGIIMMEPENLFELIPGRKIGKDQPVFIIAEIGQNHNGKNSQWQ